MQIPSLNYFQIAKMDKIVHLSELSDIQVVISQTHTHKIYLNKIVYLVADGQARIRLNIEVLPFKIYVP